MLTEKERETTERLIHTLGKLQLATTGRDFLSRIIAEDGPDPEETYFCDICLQRTKGDDGRFMSDDPETFICRWCYDREVMGINGGET